MTMQPFDVTEHIRGRVREVIIGSIPDEAMDAMIKREYEKFFKPSNYAGGTSPFDDMVRRIIEELIRDKIRDWVTRNMEQQWDDAGMMKLVGNAVEQLVPIVQAAYMRDVTSRVLLEIKQRL